MRTPEYGVYCGKRQVVTLQSHTTAGGKWGIPCDTQLVLWTCKVSLCGLLLACRSQPSPTPAQQYRTSSLAPLRYQFIVTPLAELTMYYVCMQRMSFCSPHNRLSAMHVFFAQCRKRPFFCIAYFSAMHIFLQCIIRRPWVLCPGYTACETSSTS